MANVDHKMGTFRHGMGDGGYADMTLGTDIPGRYGVQNILPGTDPGEAGHSRLGAENMPAYNAFNHDALLSLIGALLQRQSYDAPAPLTGGIVPGALPPGRFKIGGP